MAYALIMGRVFGTWRSSSEARRDCQRIIESIIKALNCPVQSPVGMSDSSPLSSPNYGELDACFWGTLHLRAMSGASVFSERFHQFPREVAARMTVLGELPKRGDAKSLLCLCEAFEPLVYFSGRDGIRARAPRLSGLVNRRARISGDFG